VIDGKGLVYKVYLQISTVAYKTILANQAKWSAIRNTFKADGVPLAVTVQAPHVTWPAAIPTSFHMQASRDNDRCV